ncbi:MAG TPA: fused MFS/spermidine synthase [Acetobacteraceae bacterium]|nr:fused MFS/spermidine synthase [Acetobacteraceae bacterium]
MKRLSVGFFCTGFAALLCQIVWQRMLGIFAGSDTVSAALVVGAFLAGLGFGSLIGAWLADRLSPARALLGFALAEVGVALFALLSKPFLYDILAQRLAGQVDQPAAIFALCFAGLVLPTTLMGLSLPLLARAIAERIDQVAERIGWLYGLNTVGAGLGALLGGWVILGAIGFEAALVLAAGLELFAAALALTLWRGLSRAAPPRSVRAEAEGAGFGSLPLWCALIFVSGYIIVALEIVWVRMLGQVGQFHAYLFPTVLGVFLLADGLGTAVAARMVRRLADPRPAFFAAQAGGFVLGVLLLGALWLALPHWPLSTYVSVDSWRLGGRSLWMTVAVVVVVVAPPSFLIGMTFPYVQRAVQRDLASVGARVGWVQLANILGNAAGSIGTGLVTFHFLGTAGTILLLSVLSVGLMTVWVLGARGRGRLPALAAACACAVPLLLTPGNASLWQRMHGVAPGGAHALAEDRSGVVAWREARLRQEGGSPGPFFILGHSQASIPFDPHHMVLGATGPLLHPDPRRMFVVGMGSGGSPWGALAVPKLREMHVVELIGPAMDVLRQMAAREPEGVVAALLADPRLHARVADGRRTLARSPDGHWDIIQADAIYPQTSHSGLLYSREYLELVRRKLAPGGLAVQWAPSWTVVETFLSVFPHVVLLKPRMILIGSDGPIEDAQERLVEGFADPAIMARLSQGNPARAAGIAAQVAGEAIAWGPDSPRRPAPLTDLFPRDEFFMNNPVRDTWDTPIPGHLLPRAPVVARGHAPAAAMR